MLQNPYNPLGIQWQDNHLVQGRVSQEDFFFLKQKFPYYPGLIDKVITNIFKATIDELRKRDQEQRIETAVYIDDPSYRILDDVIASLTFVERRTVGEHSIGGDSATQHESGGTNSVHPEVQRPEVERTDKEGRAKTGKRSSKGTKKKEKQR
jgi:hypothetical protein